MTFAEQVGSLRRSLHRALARYLAERTDRPLAHLQALRVISRSEVQTQAQLAERLLIDAPAASRMLSRLEEEGLVKRTQGADRRCVCIAVTGAAKKEIALFEGALKWLDQRVREELSVKEYEATKAVLGRVQLKFAK
jgi:DNA-binding MarR family transcriptional regulator